MHVAFWFQRLPLVKISLEEHVLYGVLITVPDVSITDPNRHRSIHIGYIGGDWHAACAPFCMLLTVAIRIVPSWVEPIWAVRNFVAASRQQLKGLILWSLVWVEFSGGHSTAQGYTAINVNATSCKT